MGPRKLRALLETVRRGHGQARLALDPLGRVKRFREPGDQEVAGFLAATLAFGRVEQILASLDGLLARLDLSPARAVDSLTPRQILRRLAGFRHRWLDERAVARLLLVLGEWRREAGSLSSFLRGLALAPGSPHRVRGLLCSLAVEASRVRGAPGRSAGVFPFVFPSPRDGSACKRLCLFLRWMARPGDDGMDLGLFTWLRPRELVVPLDVHVFRAARRLGLTGRRTPGFAAAEEITSSLARIHPQDPLRYDFALCHLGMAEHRAASGRLRLAAGRA